MALDHEIKLIAFLGNVGERYERTRHNIGWMLADHVSSSQTWDQQFKGGVQKVEGKLFLKPYTFMNLSGESVAQALRYYKWESKNLLVVHDELDLPFGTLMLKQGGGIAGHNGLRSIVQHLDPDFYRLRLGIDRPAYGSVSSWVLSAFSATEKKHLNDFLIFSSQVFESLLVDGFKKTCQKYNKKSFLGD